MADRVSASIALGGQITSEQFAVLCPLIALGDLRLDWDGELFAPEQRPENGPLCLFAHDVPWGNFDALEQYCSDKHIAYVRWSGSCPGSFGAERIVYDGTSGPFNFSVDEDDRLVLHVETITRLGSIRAIRRYIAEAEIDLPPFAVADGDAPPD